MFKGTRSKLWCIAVSSCRAAMHGAWTILLEQLTARSQSNLRPLAIQASMPSSHTNTANWLECPAVCVQRYMELGAWPVEHVASLRCQGSYVVVAKLAAILYNYTDNEYLRVVEPPEMLALLRVIAMLAQRWPPCPLT